MPHPVGKMPHVRDCAISVTSVVAVKSRIYILIFFLNLTFFCHSFCHQGLKKYEDVFGLFWQIENVFIAWERDKDHLLELSYPMS